MVEFLNMGGYAPYVWSSYGLAAALLVGLTLASARRLRHRQADLARLEAARPRRRRAEGAPTDAVPADAEGEGRP